MMRANRALIAMFMATLTITAMTGVSAGAASSNTYPPIERAAPPIASPCTSPSSSPPLPPAELRAIEKRITAFVGHHLTSIGQCGNGIIELALAPGSEDLAKKVRAHFGPTIQIDIGLSVWDGRPGPSPTCGDLPKPSSEVAGYSIALDLGSRNVISGANLKGHVALRDTDKAPVRLLTTNPIEVVITKPGTRRVVGLYAGFIAGTAYVPLLIPGQTRAIPIVGGTARCDGGIGSALPPGHYDAVAEVSGVGVDGPGGGLDGKPPPTYFTPFVPIEIVR